MILPLEALNSTNFELSNIHLLFQRPVYRHLAMSERLVTGFLYITHGKCTYTTGSGRKLVLKPGSVIYLPRGGRRSLDIPEEGIDFYRVDFDITVNQEVALFSNEPMLLAEHVSPGFRDCISALEFECRYEHNHLAKAQWLLGALAALLPHPSCVYTSRVGPAIRYIDEHFTEPFNVRELADLCHLSTAQFYNLFHQEFGKTPLDYRDELLIRRIRLLLESGETSVTEISEMLGFSSPSYFSRFCKRLLGISPATYQAERKKKSKNDDF